MSPPLEAFGLADFGAPAIEIAAEQQVVAPYEADGLDRMLGAMHHAYTVEGCSEREALLRAVKVLRDELAPCIRSPRGVKDRPPSRKARRRVIGPLDQRISEWGSRHG